MNELPIQRIMDAVREEHEPKGNKMKKMTLLTAMVEMNHAGNLLYDSETGVVLRDFMGDEDSPEAYVVLLSVKRKGIEFLAVEGPSLQIDVYGPDAGQIHRNALELDSRGNIPLEIWINDNYPECRV